MISGKLREYGWSDIAKLIYADAGIADEAKQRTHGEMWYVGGFSPPSSSSDTIIRVHVYDKSFTDRMKDMSPK